MVGSSEQVSMEPSACLTDESSQPNQSMSCLVFLAVNAVLVVRIRELLFEEGFEFGRLLNLAGCVESDHLLFTSFLVLLSVDNDFLLVLLKPFRFGFLRGLCLGIHKN